MEYEHEFRGVNQIGYKHLNLINKNPVYKIAGRFDYNPNANNNNINYFNDLIQPRPN